MNRQDRWRDHTRDVLLSLPFMLAVGIVPLLVKYKYLNLYSYRVFSLRFSDDHDLFNWYKSQAICLLGLASILWIWLRLQKLPQTWRSLTIFVPLAFMAVFLASSTAMSPWYSMALWGFPQVYEGTLVLVSYYALCIGAFLWIDNHKREHLVFGALVTSGALMVLIGIGEYCGYPLLSFEMIRKAVLGASSNNPDLFLSFAPYEGVAGTLMNSNYMGGYAALLLTVFFITGLVMRNRLKAFILFVMSLLMAWLLLVTQSRGGLLSALIAVFCGLLLMRSQCLRNLRYFALLGLISLISLGIASQLTPDSQPWEKVKKTFTTAQWRLVITMREAASLLTNDFSDSTTFSHSHHRWLKDLYVSPQGVLVIKGPEAGLSIAMDGVGLVVSDDEGRRLPLIKNAQTFNIADPRFFVISFTLGIYQDLRTIQIWAQDFNELLVMTQTGFRLLKDGVLANLSERGVVNWGIPDTFLAYRFYIWARTLPLLYNSVFLGKGPGTFALEFPHRDLVGRNHVTNGFFAFYPHNSYLQIAHAQGLLALGCYLFFLGSYLIRGATIFLRHGISQTRSQVALGLYCGILCFGLVSFVNDSTPGVSVVFWVLMGWGQASLSLQPNNVYVRS